MNVLIYFKGVGGHHYWMHNETYPQTICGSSYWVVHDEIDDKSFGVSFDRRVPCTR